MANLRLTVDYVRYLDRRFADSPYLRRRLEKYLRGPVLTRLTRLPYGVPGARAAVRGMLALERVVPSDRRTSSGRSPPSSPMSCFVTPLVGRSRPQPPADRHGEVGADARTSRSGRDRDLGPPDDEGHRQGRARPAVTSGTGSSATRPSSCTAFRAAASSSPARSSSTAGSTGSRGRPRASSSASVGLDPAARRALRRLVTQHRAARSRRSRSSGNGSPRSARAASRRSSSSPSSCGRIPTTSRPGPEVDLGGARRRGRPASPSRAADDRRRTTRSTTTRSTPRRRWSGSTRARWSSRSSSGGPC